MREFCTSGSVGAPASNPRGDPTPSAPQVPQAAAWTPARPPDRTLVYREIVVGEILSGDGRWRTDYVLEIYEADLMVRAIERSFILTTGRGRLDGQELRDDSWALLRTQTFEGQAEWLSRMSRPVYNGGELRLRRTSIRLEPPVAAEERTRGATFENGDAAIDLMCHPHTRLVLVAGAAPAAPRRECGNHEWRPAKTHAMATLGCQIRADDPRYGGQVLEFSAAPGIEQVSEDSDCVFQGEALREIAKAAGRR